MDKNEWWFGDLDEVELEDCFLYEFFRESFILLLKGSVPERDYPRWCESLKEANVDSRLLEIIYQPPEYLPSESGGPPTRREGTPFLGKLITLKVPHNLDAVPYQLFVRKFAENPPPRTEHDELLEILSKPVEQATIFQEPVECSESQLSLDVFLSTENIMIARREFDDWIESSQCRFNQTERRGSSRHNKAGTLDQETSIFASEVPQEFHRTPIALYRDANGSLQHFAATTINLLIDLNFSKKKIKKDFEKIVNEWVETVENKGLPKKFKESSKRAGDNKRYFRKMLKALGAARLQRDMTAPKAFAHTLEQDCLLYGKKNNDSPYQTHDQFRAAKMEVKTALLQLFLPRFEIESTKSGLAINMGSNT